MAKAANEKGSMLLDHLEILHIIYWPDSVMLSPNVIKGIRQAKDLPALDAVLSWWSNVVDSSLLFCLHLLLCHQSNLGELQRLLFVVLLAVIVQLYYHLSNLRGSANHCWKGTFVFSYATVAKFNFGLSLYRVLVCSVSYPVFRVRFQDINWMVNTAGVPPGSQSPPKV